MKIKTWTLFMSDEASWREIGFSIFPELGDIVH